MSNVGLHMSAVVTRETFESVLVVFESANLREGR